jgi:hypothetical protein
MATRLTPAQFLTLDFIERGGGRTMLLPVYWRDRHHQTMVRGRLLRLRADPFKTKANMLHGSITKLGREAVKGASDAIRAKAKVISDRAYRKYIRDIEEGRIEA